MAANISFNVKVFLENAAVLPELRFRTAHLAPAFDAIFKEWTELNAQKFEQAVGAELSGADVFDEEWVPVTPEYFKRKHEEGTAKVTKKAARGGKASYEGTFPNWLLVRTGALRDAMINPDALFSLIEDEQAVFGTPNDPDLADIVRWQAGARQKQRDVIFLSDPDVNAIKRIIQDYLSMGGDFAELRSEEAFEALNRKSEEAKMDAEFASTIGSDS